MGASPLANGREKAGGSAPFLWEINRLCASAQRAAAVGTRCRRRQSRAAASDTAETLTSADNRGQIPGAGPGLESVS
jgi:hypothetical protein